MLKIKGKTFMNIQEAVQWLLDNNALPFQCTANYAGNTEIGMGTIVNPSPAKVRIGSLIFFADSKVSTVVGITENGFICSNQYNNLVDDIAYVTSVSINASGHLITTLSDGQTIDAGIIKQVSSFSINASQQLVATFNDGTTQNLGAIFSGNVNIAGNLTADSIIENMSGYSFTKREGSEEGLTNWDSIYVGVVKNGNKLTLVIFGAFIYSSITGGYANIAIMTLPSAVASKIYPFTIGGVSNVVSNDSLTLMDEDAISNFSTSSLLIQKYGVQLAFQIRGISTLTIGKKYLFRIEKTFLLSENLAS